MTVPVLTPRGPEMCHLAKVAIVGNAQSILEHAQGAEIDDEHTVVIRLNYGIPKNGHSRALGRRTTVWAGMEAPEKVPAWTMEAWWLHPLTAAPLVGPPMWSLSHTLWEKIRETTPSPSTGLRAAWLVAHQAPLKVDLYGFDLFETPSWCRKTARVGRCWNPCAERKVLDELGFTEDGKISGTWRLTGAL